MTVVLEAQQRAVGDHPLIGEHEPVANKCVTSLPPPVCWIAVVVKRGGLLVRTGIPRSTVSISHAWTLRVCPPTRAMEHTTGDGSPEIWLLNWVGEFCGDHRVNVIRCEWTMLTVKDEQDVGMGQASFLILDYPGVGNDLPKQPVVSEVMEEGSQFAVEDPCHNVRPVTG